MSDIDEKSYSLGSAWAYQDVMSHCLRRSGIEDPSDVDQLRDALAARVAERAAVLMILRDVCGEFGDNDWPDDLMLSDVIEKHLAKHLWALPTGARSVLKG